jgi:hypothetical protein
MHYRQLMTILANCGPILTDDAGADVIGYSIAVAVYFIRIKLKVLV